MAAYWKRYVWEYLLCVTAAATLLLNAAQGFYIPDALADNLLLALAACAVLLLVFFLGGYNKRTLVLIPALTAVLMVLAILLLRAKGVDIVDEPGSGTASYIYWISLAVICIVVYLGSRTRLGVVLLLLVGGCTHAMLQFLEYPVYPWAAVGFAASCVLLFLLRQYRAQALQSSTAQPDFFRFFRSGLLMVLSAAVLSCGVFFAVLRPLNPPVMELEFFERYLMFNIVEHTGISSYYSVPNPEIFTDQADEGRDETQDQGDIPSADQEEESEPEPDMPDSSKTGPEALTGQTPLSAVSYTATPVSKLILALLLVLLALGLPPFVKIQLRRQKMRRMEALEPKQQIQALYGFYLKKFQTLGWRKRDGETPVEFAARSGAGLDRYLSGTCGLDVLTDAFVLARYSTKAPSGECCAQCREIYGVFLKNCRQQMGRRRYFGKFYAL